MTIIDIILDNLLRRKARAAFLLIGLTIGVGTVVALRSLTSSIQQEVAAQLDQYGANIVVVPGSRVQEVSYGGVAISAASFDIRALSDHDVRAIRQIPYANRLSAIAPKLLGETDLQGHLALLAGVDFQQELRIKRWWQISGRVPGSDKELLLGYELARELGVIAAVAEPQAGRQQNHESHQARKGFFTLVKPQVSIGSQEFQVAGVLHETGGQDDVLVYSSLTAARRVLGKADDVSLVEVSALCYGCPIEDIVAQIQTALPGAKVSAVQQAVKARIQTVERLSRFSAVISAVMILVAFLLVSASMSASVLERTREIGVMRALGFRKRHIAQIIVGEAALISLLGGFLGWAAGTSSGMVSAKRLSETAVVQPSLTLAGIAIATALLVGAASSVYPAIKAARLDPTESLRYF